MKFSIIASRKDIAGMNILNNLIKNFPFARAEGLFYDSPFYRYEVKGKKIFLYSIPDESIFYENAEKEIVSDFFVFASKHKSKSGEKTISAHFTGNFSKAEYGGKEREFSVAPALFLKTVFKVLNETAKGLDYNVSLEATHHGPLLRKPSIFVEIGSLEHEWRDEKAGLAVSKAIVDSILEYEKKEYGAAIGFGGTHYCSNFNKVLLETDVALSHICPKYNVSLLDEELILKMVEASYEKIDYALLDWKGLSSEDKAKLVQLLEKLKIRWKKVEEVR